MQASVVDQKLVEDFLAVMARRAGQSHSTRACCPRDRFVPTWAPGNDKLSGLGSESVVPDTSGEPNLLATDCY
jgi:hypothetical protein